MKYNVLSRIFIVMALSVGFLGYSHAAQLGLVTKYSDSGGGVGNLNQVGDQVNGRVICPSANTNANTVPGCDMSDYVGYHNNGTINDPSDDYYTGDLIIRTNDIFEFVAGWNWIKETDGVEQVAIVCQLPAAQSTTRPGYKWAFLPGSCNTSLSSISTDGKTITCVRSNFDTNDVGTYAEDLPFGVQALGGNENGYTPGDIVCSAASVGAATANDDTDNTSLTITASPRWNMQHVVYHYAPGQTFNGQTGWLMYFKQYIEVDEVYGSTDSVGGFLGNESLGSDATITYTQDMSQISPNAQLYDCDPDIAWINGGDPYNYYYVSNPERSIATPDGVQSMNCTSTGTGGVINVTLEHLDATLSHYARYDYDGNALPVNRKIAAINMIRVFIPLDDVRNGEDGIFGTADDGQLITRGQITNFDPNGISGLSNFASTTENTGDNYQEYTLYYANGYWDKYYRGIYNADGTWYPWTYPYDIINYRSGRGSITPGGVFYTEQNYSNNGGSDVTGVVLCDVFDANTYDTFADPSTNLNDGAVWSHTPGTPMHLYNNFGDGIPYHYEYATTYETSWPPDPYTTHGDQVAQECAGTGTVWYNDYNVALSNGPITKARLVIDAPVKPNQTILRWVGHKARSTDLSGNLLPGGTLLPNYASFSDSLSDRFGSFWKHNSYRPNSYTGAHIGGGGDRLILQRAKARITKSASPLDQDGSPTGGPASTPGLKIRYSLTGSFTTDGNLNETSMVVIKDLLPPGIRYVAGSTQGGHGEPTISNNCSDVQDLVDQGYPCSSSNQILIWNLGSRTSNVAIPAVTFDAIVDVDVAEGAASNYALIESPVDQSPAIQRTANANTIISIPRSLLIVKGIEQGRNQFNVDGLSNWVKFTVNMRNGTPGSLMSLDVIDVFPFRGDNTSGVPFTVGTTTITTHRTPATSYTGQFEFVGGAINNIDNCSTGATTWYYTDRTPSQVDLSPTATSNQSGGTTTWCAGTENGPDGGCGFTKQQATAVRVIGAGMGSQGVCQVKLIFATNNNLGGDIYTNSAGAYAQGVSLPVLSNAVSALVYDYQIGDTVWFDNNQDGLIGSGEQLVSGAILSLYTNTGALIGTTTTNASGYYIFTGLMSGTYSVSLTPISGAIYGYDQDSTNRYSDGTTTLSLSGSSITSRMDIDFGLYELGSIAGVIYHDTDRGQLYASGDNPLSGMVVTLSGTDFSGNIVYLTGLTDGQGAYLFDHLALGVYSVSYDDSSSLLADSVQRGTISGSPVGTTSGVQQNTITLGYGNHVINNNFGLISPGSINGTVWYDMDANQTLDMSEVYTSGAKVIVTYTNSIEGVVTTIVYTDAAGNWSVGDIQTGSTYTVDIDMSYGPTNGYKLTTNNITTNGFVSYGTTQHVSDHGLYLTNVMVSKSVNVSDATLGDTLTYTIVYQNTSSGTAYNVSVYDLFPFDFLQWVSSTSAPSIGSTNEVTPTTLGWTIGTLAPGQAGSISIQAMIYTGNEADIVQNLAAIDTTGTGYVTGNLITVTTGSITTTGTTTETTTGDNLSSVQVRIYRVDLGIVKDVDRTTVGPNDIFEYTLHISNNTGTVSQIVVEDDLDTNLIYIGMGSGLITSSPVISGQTLLWTGITLAPRATSTLKILVKPAQYLLNGTTLNNTAFIGRYSGSGQIIPLYELDSSNNVSSAQVTLSGTNYASIAGHVYFDENSSSGFDLIDAYQGGVVVRLLSGGSVIATTSTNMSGYYYFGNLVAGTYEVQYDVPGGYHRYTSVGGQGASSNGLGNLNSATVSATTIGSITLIDGNNSINNDFGFVRPYDLAVTKTSDIGTGTSDTVVAYTITYANLGGYPVPDTVVDDIWPSALMDFVSASIAPSTSTASGSNTQYTWNLGTLSPYSSGTIVITGMIKQGLASGTVVENRAIVRSTTATGETNILNNDSSTQRSTADTDLSVIKTTTSTTSIIDTLVTWVIDYTNAGPQTAYDVTVHDLVPNGLTYESSNVTPDSRTMITGGEHLTWKIGNLLAGTSGKITITTRTNTGVTHLAPYINTAVISGSTTERTLINNTSLAQVVAINKLPFDGYVWYDSDNSSTTGNVRSDTESSASGIVVEIYNMSGVLVDTLITNSSGIYHGSILPGEYRTNIIIPNHYSLTTTNNTPFTIDVNSIISTHVDDDGLYHKPGTFTATVWYDDDSSQSRGTGELMVNGVPVQVYDSKNRLVGTYLTSMDGIITGSLIPDTYTFKLVDITSYTTTTLQTLTYVIASETHHHVYDFGIVRGQNNVAPGSLVGSNSASSTQSNIVGEATKTTDLIKIHTDSSPVSVVSEVRSIKPKPQQLKPKNKQVLDANIVVEKIITKPDLSPRTFVIPAKLLDTGTPEAMLKKKGVTVKKHPKVETSMADWIQPVSADVAAMMTLDDWIARMPQSIRDSIDQENVKQWVVVPSLGIIAPINDIPTDTQDWSTLVGGGEISINQYLKKGVVHYPLSKNAGELGNFIIAGHSSYYKSDNGLFKTIFTALPLLNSGDEILIYAKETMKSKPKSLTKKWDEGLISESIFVPYRYLVKNSYEIRASDTWILQSRNVSHLTLFTCTPIGSNKNRRYIDAELQK